MVRKNDRGAAAISSVPILRQASQEGERQCRRSEGQPDDRSWAGMKYMPDCHLLWSAISTGTYPFQRRLQVKASRIFLDTEKRGKNV